MQNISDLPKNTKYQLEALVMNKGGPEIFKEILQTRGEDGVREYGLQIAQRVMKGMEEEEKRKEKWGVFGWGWWWVAFLAGALCAILAGTAEYMTGGWRAVADVTDKTFTFVSRKIVSIVVWVSCMGLILRGVVWMGGKLC